MTCNPFTLKGLIVFSMCESLLLRKLVFPFTNYVRHKPGPVATEARLKLERNFVYSRYRDNVNKKGLHKLFYLAG